MRSWILHHMKGDRYRDLWLLIITVLLVLIAGKALSVATDIQKSRVKATYENCRLLRSLVLDAVPKGHESPTVRSQVTQYLYTTGLDNCVAYTIHVTGMRPTTKEMK